MILYEMAGIKRPEDRLTEKQEDVLYRTAMQFISAGGVLMPDHWIGMDVAEKANFIAARHWHDVTTICKQGLASQGAKETAQVMAEIDEEPMIEIAVREAIDKHHIEIIQEGEAIP